MKQKFALVFCFILISFAFVSLFEIPIVNAGGATIFSTDFDSGEALGSAPLSLDWTGHTSLWSVNYTDQSYVTISDDTYVSAPYSLKLNDSSTLSPYLCRGKVWFDMVDYSDGNARLEIWIRVTNQTVDYPRFWTARYDGSIATYAPSYLYYDDDGDLMAGSTSGYVDVGDWVENDWLNFTLVFSSTNVKYYINGTLNTVGYYWNRKQNFNVLRIEASQTTSAGVVYVDNLSIEGTVVSEPLYFADDGINLNYGFISTDYYKTKIRRVDSGGATDEGQLNEYRVETSWGSWRNLVDTVGPYIFWSESANSLNVQKGIGDVDTDASLTITDNATTVTYNFSGWVGTELYFQNTIYFFSTSRNIYFDIYREYNFTKSGVKQRQVDFLFLSNEISKVILTNQTGIYNNITTQDTYRQEYGVTSIANYFPFFGYYFRAGITIASIVTYMHETDGLVAGFQHQLDWTKQTTYNEWELTFAKAWGGNNQPVTTGDIERCSGVFMSYAGDESVTDSVKSLSQSLYSDWSSHRTYLGYLADLTNDLYVTATSTLKATTYSNGILTTTLNASSTQTTKTLVYCGDLGQPINVTGADSATYDLATRICTISLTHASTQDVIVEWAIAEVAEVGSTGLAIVALTIALGAFIFVTKKRRNSETVMDGF